MSAERGQAQIELVAAIPLVLAAVAVIVQLMAVARAQSLADGAAEAGAIAIGNGLPPAPAVRAALPGYDEVGVGSRGGRVTVRVEPRSVLPGLGALTEVRSRAWIRVPQADGS